MYPSSSQRQMMSRSVRRAGSRCNCPAQRAIATLHFIDPKRAAAIALGCIVSRPDLFAQVAKVFAQMEYVASHKRFERFVDCVVLLNLVYVIYQAVTINRREDEERLPIEQNLEWVCHVHFMSSF